MDERIDADELRARFFEQLSPEARAAIGTLVDAAGVAVYVAAGVVRDLLLDRQPRDIDLVVDADAIEIVRRALPDVRLTLHERFRTASFDAAGTNIDVATARRERYQRPGALPDVEPASIAEDLTRRDFSINAMALALTGEARLLDPTGGVEDTRNRIVRLLHEGSIHDDATRMFRAARYAARLGFAFDPRTETQLREGARFVATIGGERLRREIELIFDEGATVAGRALELAASFGALSAIHPALEWDEGSSRTLVAPASAHASATLVGFALLTAAASGEDCDSIIERLSLTRGENAAVRGMASMRSAASMLERPDVKPSGVVVLLDRLPIASVAAYAGLYGASIAGQLALRYLEEWRHERPLLSGKDLIEMGVPEGPQVERGLQLIRAARLDGWARDRDGERALAQRFVKSIRDSGSMTSPLVVDLDDRRN